MHQVAAPVGVSAEVQLPAMAEAGSVIVRAYSNESLDSVVGKISYGSSEAWDDDLEDSADSKTMVVRVLDGDVVVIAKLVKRNLMLEFEAEAMSDAAAPACSSTASSEDSSCYNNLADSGGEATSRSSKRMKM